MQSLGMGNCFRYSVTFFLVLLTVCRGESADDGDEMRLPQTILPISYNIQLLPIIEEGNFTTLGFVEIVMDCVEATSSITMNIANITVDQSSIIVTFHLEMYL